MSDKKPILNITEKIISQSEYGLSFDQQDFIEANYKNMTPLKAAQEVYRNLKIDEHSDEFSNIKKFYAKLNRNKQVVELTDSQRKFIETNGKLMRPFEMAKLLFEDKDIQPLGAEAKTIIRYCKALGLAPEDGVTIDTGAYNPPDTIPQIINKINACDINANFLHGSLTPQQRKCVESLKKYLSSPRFLSTINGYTKQVRRDLFEQTFIQSIYEKSDVTSEELNMYISLCTEYVLMSILQRQVDRLSSDLEDIDMSNVDEDDMPHVQQQQLVLLKALSTKTTEYDQCQKRMQGLQESLAGKRSQRMKDEASVNESLTKFVELFKTEESRKKLLRVAEARNLEVAKEIDRIASAEEYIAQVMGISPEEILNN